MKMICSLDLNERRDQTRRMRSQEAMTFDELRGELEVHCRTLLAPEIAISTFGGPYIVGISEAGLSANGWFAGLWSPTMATWFRSVLSNRWSGEGPTFVLNEAHLTRQHGTFEDARTLAATIAAHELSHAIQFPGLFGRMPSDTPQAFRDGTWFREQMALPEAESITTRTSDESHGPVFVRIALHVFHRMTGLIGQRLPLSCLHDWRGFGLSPGESYRDALGEELKRLESFPLTAVLQMKPPVEFQKLWARDVLASLNC